MAAINYQARAHETRDEMVKSYAAAHDNLWGKPPPKPRRPIVLTTAPIPEEYKPVEKLPQQVPAISDDEYGQLLASLCDPNAEVNRPHLVLRAVAIHYAISIAELKGSSRRRGISDPRQIAMYIITRGVGCSYPKTGMLLGNRDHTTILHGVRMVMERMAANPSFARHVRELMSACGVEVI